MRQSLWIMSICNKRDEVGVFILNGMNCQVPSLEPHAVVVWLTQTDTMRQNVMLTHSGLIQKIKSNHMLVVKTKSSKRMADVPFRRNRLKNWVICCVFVFVSQLTNAATCTASPRRHEMWSSCREWLWTAHAARTRTLTVCVCAGNARWET